MAQLQKVTRPLTKKKKHINRHKRGEREREDRVMKKTGYVTYLQPSGRRHYRGRATPIETEVQAVVVVVMIVLGSHI